MGHFPPRPKRPTTDGERAENNMAQNVGQAWESLPEGDHSQLEAMKNGMHWMQKRVRGWNSIDILHFAGSASQRHVRDKPLNVRETFVGNYPSLPLAM